MTSKQRTLYGGFLALPLIGQALLALLLVPAAFAQSTLPTEVAGKAKTFKEADLRYVKVFCDDDLRKQRAPAKAARDASQEALSKAISSTIDQSAGVQKALDVATVLGTEVSKAANNPTASGDEKAAAKAKFEKAKQDLRAAVADENARIRALIKNDFGVTLTERDGCPADKSEGSPKRAKHKAVQDEKTARRRDRGASGPAPGGGSVSGSFSFGGGGGMGVSFGR